MRCLVVQTAFLGDVILTTPLVSLLRNVSGIEACCVVTTPVGAEFLRTQGLSTGEIIVYGKHGADRGPAGFLRVAGSARSWRPDCALVPHRSFRSALLAYASGAGRRIGFDTSGGRWLLTDTVPYRAAGHEIERTAALAGVVGAAPPGERVPFRLEVPPEAAEALEEKLLGAGLPEGPTVLVAPGSRWPTKRWPPERFARAAEQVAGRLGGPIVIAGGSDDRQACLETRKAVESGAFDLCGSLSLSEWIALIARGAVLLANDSAAGHVAAGVGTPVVSVFGPTVPEQGFAPYAEASRVASAELDCRPCGRHGGLRCRRGDLACMKAVTPDDVVAKALDLVGRSA